MAAEPGRLECRIDLKREDFAADSTAGAIRRLTPGEFAWLSGTGDPSGTAGRRELLPLDVRDVGAPSWEDRLRGRPVAIATLDQSDDQPNRAAIRMLFDAGYVCRDFRDDDAGHIDLYVRSDCAQPDSLVPRRSGVVAMSSLGTNGRFANQLFQFAYLRLYALRHGLAVQVPNEWEAREVYGFPDAPTSSGQLPKLQFGAFDNDDLGLWETAEAPRNVDLWGYFQEIPACWHPHREFLRKLFSLSPAQSSRLDAWVAQVTRDGRHPLIAVHVRRGDYVHLHKDNLPWYRPVPTDWYAAWVKRQDRPSAAVFVATDSPGDVLRDLAGLDPLSGRDAPEIEGLSAAAIEFEVMRRVDMLALANSSFSRMAAILASAGQTCGCPDFRQGEIVPYQPWLDPDFWGRFDDGRHGRALFGYTPDAARARGNSARTRHGEALATAAYFEAEVDRLRDWAEALRLSAETARTSAEAARTLADAQMKSFAEAAAEAQLAQERDRKEIARLGWLGSPRGIMVRAVIPPSRMTLKLLRSTLGRRNPGLAGRIGRLQKIIDAGHYREFVAAVVGRRMPPADPIDVTKFYIDLVGEIRTKPSRVWGENAAVAVTVVLDARSGDVGQAETLESLRAQTLTGFELLWLGASLAPGDRERFPAARSVTPEDWIDQVGGEFLCWLRPGERLSPIFLETLAAALSSDRALGFVSGVVTFGDGVRSAAGLVEGSRGAAPYDFRPWLMRADDLPLLHDHDPGNGTTPQELLHLGRRGLVLSNGLISADRAQRHAVVELMPAPAAPLISHPISRGPLASMLADERTGCDPSRLLVVVPWLPLGGSEVVLLQILQRAARDWKVTIATTVRGDHSMVAAFGELTHDIHHLVETVGDANALDFLRHLVMTRRPVVVLSSNSAVAHLALQTLKADGHGFAWCDVLHNDSGLGHIVTALRAHGAIDRYVAISRKIGQTLEANGIGAHEIAVIPNGVDHLESFSPDRTDRETCRRAFGLDPTRFTLGFMGRLSAEKRPEQFIRLAAEVGRCADLQILVVGDGDRRAEIEAQITKAGLKGVHLRQVPRRTVNMIYGACDVLAMTSAVEGMPLVALEALASGCPVASTDVGDVRRIITPGVNGYLTAVDHPLGLTEGIAELAASPTRLAEMRTAARRSIVDSGFTLDAMQASYADLFAELRATVAFDVPQHLGPDAADGVAGRPARNLGRVT